VKRAYNKTDQNLAGIEASNLKKQKVGDGDEFNGSGAAMEEINGRFGCPAPTQTTPP
jgi:hypothetical protein